MAYLGGTVYWCGGCQKRIDLNPQAAPRRLSANNPGIVLQWRGNPAPLRAHLGDSIRTPVLFCFQPIGDPGEDIWESCDFEILVHLDMLTKTSLVAQTNLTEIGAGGVDMGGVQAKGRVPLFLGSLFLLFLMSVPALAYTFSQAGVTSDFLIDDGRVIFTQADRNLTR